MVDLNQALDVARGAAREAGALLRERFRQPYRVVRKSRHEMVAEVDILSQRILIERLGEAYPDHTIVSEERSVTATGDGPTWILDPLDGTHNYIAGLSNAGVSIALHNHGAFELGVIDFPIEQRMAYGIRGQGAYLAHAGQDDRPLQVSKNARLDKAVVAYDNQLHQSPEALPRLARLADEAFTIRILGAATADLCAIADGVLDARVFNHTKIVDIAAGIVILSEAGGRITDLNGTPCGLEVKEIVASNGRVHDAVIEILNNADQPSATIADHEESS